MEGMKYTPHDNISIPIELELWQNVWHRDILNRRQNLGVSPLNPSNKKHDSYQTFSTFANGYTITKTYPLRPSAGIPGSPIQLDKIVDTSAWRWPEEIARDIYLSSDGPALLEPQLAIDELAPEHQKYYKDLERNREEIKQDHTTDQPSKRSLKKQARIAERKENRKAARLKSKQESNSDSQIPGNNFQGTASISRIESENLMPSESSSATAPDQSVTSPAQHKPLVVGLRKPQSSEKMATSNEAAALNKEINENVKENTASAAPAESSTTPVADSIADQPKKKKEKAPKQPKATPSTAPTSPALIDLRVGHILRAVNHPNADSLYQSTIAMGDVEGTENTQVDEETGKIVRTVCSGLRAYIPLEEMQDRKIIVVANLKPVTMRGVKSAAMVLAASPKQEAGADPHAPDRTVELVIPPQNSEAGDKVYFEGWPYGDGKGPEKVLNPKKKQWEAIQPGFYTSEELVVGFDASACEEVQGYDKGDLIVEGKGKCTVKTLKGAVVR